MSRKCQLDWMFGKTVAKILTRSCWHVFVVRTSAKPHARKRTAFEALWNPRLRPRERRLSLHVSLNDCVVEALEVPAPGDQVANSDASLLVVVRQVTVMQPEKFHVEHQLSAVLLLWEVLLPVVPTVALAEVLRAFRLNGDQLTVGEKKSTKDFGE